MEHVAKLEVIYQTSFRTLASPSKIFDETRVLFDRIWYFNEEITKRCGCRVPEYGSGLDARCPHINWSTGLKI
jgi:hypothetical protein